MKYEAPGTQCDFSVALDSGIAATRLTNSKYRLSIWSNVHPYGAIPIGEWFGNNWSALVSWALKNGQAEIDKFCSGLEKEEKKEKQRLGLVEVVKQEVEEVEEKELQPIKPKSDVEELPFQHSRTRKYYGTDRWSFNCRLKAKLDEDRKVHPVLLILTEYDGTERDRVTYDPYKLDWMDVNDGFWILNVNWRKKVEKNS